MGISKTNLGISIDSIKNFVKTIAGTHNSIPGRDATDSHPISAITGLDEVATKANNIATYDKYLNLELDFTLCRINDTYTPIENQCVPFQSKNGNIQVVNGLFKMKPRTSYEITIVLAYANPGSKVYANIHYQLKVNGTAIAFFAPYRESTAIDYEQPYILNVIYTNDSDIEVECGLYVYKIYTSDKLNGGISTMTIKEVGRSIAIDPVEYVNTNSGIEDTPVGHILSVMGKTVPKHYLICDGSIYNITDYPYLSQYIKDQFGAFNYFGGDGTTTFAVPDLRNEFLRGYHGNKTEHLSGEIGAHQSGTVYPYFQSTTNAAVTDLWLGTNVNTGGAIPTNIDSSVNNSKGVYIAQIGNSNRWITTAGFQNQPTVYTARPTNTAVLYCIKYEPTYFMSIQGLIEENILWEGSVGTSDTALVDVKVNLNDSIINYDKIRIHYYSMNGTYPNFSKHNDFKEIPTYDLMYLIDLKTENSCISCIFGYASSPAYTNILLAKSTYTSFSLDQNQSYITKIVGIKYKTF